jgi:hypothetical protein
VVPARRRQLLPLPRLARTADGRLTGNRRRQAVSETVALESELIAEIRRLDARMDGMDRELRTAIDIRERLAALEAHRAG